MDRYFSSQAKKKWQSSTEPDIKPVISIYSVAFHKVHNILTYYVNKLSCRIFSSLNHSGFVLNILTLNINDIHFETKNLI